MTASVSLPPLLPFLAFFAFSCVGATTFILQNDCKITIWPGILSGAGHPIIGKGGFRLRPGKSKIIRATTGWSGRFWPRTGCHFDESRHGTCRTGDCRGSLHCSGVGGAPPVSLAEFTLNSPIDFYDVSLVDGYNVPVSIVPTGNKPGGNCQAVKCEADLNRLCPRALRVMGDKKAVVACKSACLAFGTPRHCCTGEYGGPQACKPTAYSRFFKRGFPKAYSYAYDDATSTFTCAAANYLVKFC